MKAIIKLIYTALVAVGIVFGSASAKADDLEDLINSRIDLESLDSYLQTPLTFNNVKYVMKRCTAVYLALHGYYLENNSPLTVETKHLYTLFHVIALNMYAKDADGSFEVAKPIVNSDVTSDANVYRRIINDNHKLTGTPLFGKDYVAKNEVMSQIQEDLIFCIKFAESDFLKPKLKAVEEILKKHE